MTNPDTEFTSRILIVDDTPSIHEDFRKLLTPAQADDEVDSMLAELAGESLPAASEDGSRAPTFLIDSAFQGQDALTVVQAALVEKKPNSMAFVDMRMPPGWDGLETIERLWTVAPELQIVLCTAFSDHNWSEIDRRLHRPDRLLILKKPFDAIEARQLAHALCEKARLSQENSERLRALHESNRLLKAEVELRRKVEKQLQYDALHDVLTQLPNRALLCDRIERSLAMSKRDPGFRFALLFVDLDDFKIINDSLGHKAGDRLLIEVAKRLVSSVRQTDCATRNNESTTARLGGDEFVVLLDGLRCHEDAQFIAARILSVLAEPFLIEGHEVRPKASIGVAIGRDDYDDPDALLRDADTALYRAKATDKAGVAVFDQQMRRDAIARLRVHEELSDAIQRGHLFLQYQPIVALASARIIGFEALVRWRHPTQGVIPPLEFVPVAEETGLIIPLGEWVLRQACAQVADWHSRIPNAAHLTINVNFSSKQFKAPSFVENIVRVLDESGLDRSKLNIELTESLVLETTGRVAGVLQQLRADRMNLHIDDFGTGFSSLSYLNQLPVTAVKLDKSFLKGAGSDATRQSTLSAVIQMAHAQKLKITAEGVETASEVALLRELGCDMAQGFYFYRPADPEQIERILVAESVPSPVA